MMTLEKSSITQTLIQFKNKTCEALTNRWLISGMSFMSADLVYSDTLKYHQWMNEWMNKGQRVRILVSAVCCFSICVMMNWFWSPCSPSVSVIHNCCPAISDSRVLQKSHAVEGGGQGRCFIFMFFQGLIVLKATSELLKPQIQQLFMSLTRADQIVLKPYLSYVLDMEDHIQIWVTRQTSP